MNIDTQKFVEKMAEEYLNMFKQKCYWELAAQTFQQENEGLKQLIVDLQEQLAQQQKPKK